MTNIQIFGGPGTGKSTFAAGLFYKMKKDNLKVEYIQEYAKDLTYGADDVKLNDQLLILAEQHHRLLRVSPHVDYVIRDSPFLLSLIYQNPNDKHLDNFKFADLVLSMYRSYNNINIFLNRNFEEAKAIDSEIKSLLYFYDIPYTEFESENLDSDYQNIIKLIQSKKTVQ